VAEDNRPGDSIAFHRSVGIRPTLHYFTDAIGISMSPMVEGMLGVPVVIIFVLGATNSLNLLDGLDGLCGGVTTIITLAMLGLAVHLATWAQRQGRYVRIILCLSLVGGYWVPTVQPSPGQDLHGDAGSMLLGFVVATLMILFAEDIPRWWMASLVVFGLPSSTPQRQGCDAC